MKKHYLIPGILLFWLGTIIYTYFIGGIPFAFGYTTVTGVCGAGAFLILKA